MSQGKALSQTSRSSPDRVLLQDRMLELALSQRAPVDELEQQHGE